MPKYWKQLMIISKRTMQKQKAREEQEAKQFEQFIKQFEPEKEVHYRQLTFEDILSSRETCPC